MKKNRMLLAGLALMLLGPTASADDKVLGLDIKNLHRKSFAEAIAAPADSIRVSRRPAAGERLFVADVIEKKILEVQKLLKDAPYLAWMFGNLKKVQKSLH